MERLGISNVAVDQGNGRVQVRRGSVGKLLEIYYGDHGRDRQSRASEYMMNTLGLLVFFVNLGGSISVMHSLGDINLLTC